MTARLYTFPQRHPAHTPRAEPGVVVVLPVIRIERERGQLEPEARRRREAEFVATDFPLIDGSLTRGLGDE